MKNEIYVFSEKAAEESGYIFANLKDGSNLKYTAIYPNKEMMEKDYIWDDKVVLPLKSEDIVSIYLSVNRFNSIIDENENKLSSELKEHNSEIYVYSEKSAQSNGYLIANLKDGSAQRYTAVYHNKETMEKDYFWDDKVVLPLKSEDIVSINSSINRSYEENMMLSSALRNRNSEPKEIKNEIYVYSEKASQSGYLIAILKDGNHQRYTAIYPNKETMERDYGWDDKVILPLKSEDIKSINYTFNNINNEDITLSSALNTHTARPLTTSYKNAASEVIKALGLKFSDEDKKPNKNKIR